MAKDVLITPLDGIIQFSSSAGTGTGQVKVDGDDLVISNLVGDVLLGDGASDVFIGNGTDSVDIVFEQNGEIRDDGSGKTITLGSKTTTLILSSSSDITMQGGGGKVGIGTSNPTKELQVAGDISASGDASIGTAVNHSAVNAYGTLQVNQDADNDESGIGIQNRLNGRSLRIYVDSSNNSVLNSGDGGGQPLILNEGAGKVGIGTTTLPSVLTVDGDMKATHITASGDISGSEDSFLTVGRHGTFGHATSTNTGQVKIVTRAADNSQLVLASAGNSHTMVRRPASTTDMALLAGDGERVRIKEDGKVGIGTSSPTQELDLRGELFISSSTTNISPILIHDSSGSVLLKLSTDANQHNDLNLARSGTDKVRLRTYWPSIIDNDYYETGGGLILGSERSANNSFYGLYVSSGSNSGSAFFAGVSSPFIVQGNITASGDISSSITSTGSFGKIEIADDATITDRLTVGGVANFSGTFVNIGGGFGSTGVSIAADGDIQTDGSLTAHGNISGSSTSNLTIGGTGSFGQLEVAESTLTGSMKPLKGTFNIHYGTNAQFTGSLTAAGGYGEIMSNFAVHTELSKGDICYNIGGVWRKADADGESSTTKMLGVALQDGMSSGGQPVLIRGMARLRIGHIADSSGDEGDLVYLSTTAGKVQFAAPSTSGQFVRIVGYCLNEANDIIYFDPDKSFVEVA